MLLHVDARKQRQARRDLVAKLTAERQAAGRNSKKRSRFRGLRRRVGKAFIESLAPMLLRLFAMTWRVERTGEAGQERFAGDLPWIALLWHGRMLAMMPVKGHFARNISVLVSPSDDGGLAKIALRKFRYEVVRGSLSRRGATAMREMLSLLQDGKQLVLTPDGPRGPRHSINSGAAWLARATGIPIIPISVGVDRAWRFRSWDRMCIPKPFAKLSVHHGDPIFIERDATDEALEARSEQIRTEMIAGEEAAFGRLNVPSDFEPIATNDNDPSTSSEAPGSHRAD